MFHMVEVQNILSQVLEELNWDKVLVSMMCSLKPFARYSDDKYSTLMELDYHLEAMKEKAALREIASLLRTRRTF